MANISRLKSLEISPGNTIAAADIEAELDQLVNSYNANDTILSALIGGTYTLTGPITFTNSPKTNGIDERTAAAGVTVDSVLLKDGMVTVAGTPTTAGQVGYASNTLKYHNGSTVIDVGSIDELNDIGDVTITSVANQEVLRHNGSAWVNGKEGLTLLASATASSSATVDFTSYIDSTYGHYIIDIVGALPATADAGLWLRVSEDGGSNWKSGASDYAWLSAWHSASGTAQNYSAGDTKLSLYYGGSSNGYKNTAAYAPSLRLHFWNPAGTTNNKQFLTDYGYISNGGTITTQRVFGSYSGTTNAINAVRLLMSSGNIASGNFYLYGVRKS